MDYTPAVQHNVRRGQEKSNFEEGRTAQEIADEWLNRLVDAARADQAIDAYGCTDEIRAERFVLAGGGPGCDVTFVLRDDAVEYAVLDYYEGGPRAQAVIVDRDAEKLYEALKEYSPE